MLASPFWSIFPLSQSLKKKLSIYLRTTCIKSECLTFIFFMHVLIYLWLYFLDSKEKLLKAKHTNLFSLILVKWVFYSSLLPNCVPDVTELMGLLCLWVIYLSGHTFFFLLTPFSFYATCCHTQILLVNKLGESGNN